MSWIVIVLSPDKVLISKVAKFLFSFTLLTLTIKGKKYLKFNSLIAICLAFSSNLFKSSMIPIYSFESLSITLI